MEQMIKEVCEMTNQYGGIEIVKNALIDYVCVVCNDGTELEFYPDNDRIVVRQITVNLDGDRIYTEI